MSESVLEISNLSVVFDTPNGAVEAVKNVSFSICKGECLGLVGESGAGKSQSLLAAFGLAAANARATGSVRFLGAELLGAPRPELDAVRGKRVAFVFRDPLTALTPHLTIETQLGEVLAHHFRIRGVDAERHCVEWLERVRMADAKRRLKQYPHELSGGMRQRVMIAMAMMCEPALLVADEPTSALDAATQAQLLDIIDDLRRDTEAAVALVSHDMGVIARMAQRVAVMRQGEIVEVGAVEDICARPQTDYTRMLLAAVPRLDAPRAHELPPPVAGAPILSVDDVRVNVPVRLPGGVFSKTRQLRAVDGVTFALKAGETLGIVGESGCGKSTLARAIVQLLPRNAGAVTFLGRALLPSERESLRHARRDLQIVFEDPVASLDPRMTIGAALGEPLLTFEPQLSRAERETRVRAMMNQVGLDPNLINRYPHELSRGQSQRAGIARATIMRPKLVVCDDVLSGLDVSIQAQILELLVALQREFRTSMLFTSHDLAAARAISHTILVLYLGRAVEYGPSDVVLHDPRHPYTKALLAASLTPDPHAARSKPRARWNGDAPSPFDTRASLRFLKSRMVDDPDAVQYRPRWLEAAPGHYVAEHDPAEAAA